MPRIVLLAIVFLSLFFVSPSQANEFPPELLGSWVVSSEITYNHKVTEGLSDTKSLLTRCYTKEYYGEGLEVIFKKSQFNPAVTDMIMTLLGKGNRNAVNACGISKITRESDGKHYKKAFNSDLKQIIYTSEWRGFKEGDASFKNLLFQAELIDKCKLKVLHQFEERVEFPGMRGQPFEVRTTAEYTLNKSNSCP